MTAVHGPVAPAAVSAVGAVEHVSRQVIGIDGHTDKAALSGKDSGVIPDGIGPGHIRPEKLYLQKGLIGRNLRGLLCLALLGLPVGLAACLCLAGLIIAGSLGLSLFVPLAVCSCIRRYDHTGTGIGGIAGHSGSFLGNLRRLCDAGAAGFLVCQSRQGAAGNQGSRQDSKSHISKGSLHDKNLLNR